MLRRIVDVPVPGKRRRGTQELDGNIVASDMGLKGGGRIGQDKVEE